MCERTYCRHEHERLCSCPPVTCRDALGMAAHLAENMEQVQWSLTYNSLKDIKPYQLCLVGKCRICGGRGCLGNVFLIICHLQTSFSWHEKSQSADWPGESDLPSWFYI